MRYQIIIIFFIPIFLMAQSDEMDTIKISEVKSNYPIIAKTIDLQYVPNIHKWHYYYNLKGQHYPSLPSLGSAVFYYFYVNQIVADKYKLSYFETRDEIRMEYIVLSKNKKFWMRTKGLLLTYTTSLEEVIKYFECDSTDVEQRYGPLMIGNKFKTICHYVLCFSTGEPLKTKITLTFNKRKRLEIIQITYYHPHNMIESSYNEKNRINQNNTPKN